MVQKFVTVEDYEKLEDENKQLREDLIEFGRHGEGCAYQYDKKFPCKCGWLKTRQALVGK